jgi:hypothetical protein
MLIDPPHEGVLGLDFETRESNNASLAKDPPPRSRHGDWNPVPSRRAGVRGGSRNLRRFSGPIWIPFHKLRRMSVLAWQHVHLRSWGESAGISQSIAFCFTTHQMPLGLNPVFQTLLALLIERGRVAAEVNSRFLNAEVRLQGRQAVNNAIGCVPKIASNGVVFSIRQESASFHDQRDDARTGCLCSGC